MPEAELEESVIIQDKALMRNELGARENEINLEERAENFFNNDVLNESRASYRDNRDISFFS